MNGVPVVMPEPKPKAVKLPCGCKVKDQNANVVHVVGRRDIGLALAQCRLCKLIISIEVMRPDEPPRIVVPN